MCSSDLINMLENAIEETFMRPEHRDIWKVASSVDQAVEFLLNPDKWLDDPRKIAAI